MDLRDQLVDAVKAFVRTGDSLSKAIDELGLGSFGRIPRDSEAYKLCEKHQEHNTAAWSLARQLVELEDAETAPGKILPRDASDKPRVIVYCEGGVVVGARASEQLLLEVLDADDLEDEETSALQKLALQKLGEEYDALPKAIY